MQHENGNSMTYEQEQGRLDCIGMERQREVYVTRGQSLKAPKYVKKSDQMACSYLTNHTFKWMKGLFFFPLVLDILNRSPRTSQGSAQIFQDLPTY
jgi:hypothetical protein